MNRSTWGFWAAAFSTESRLSLIHISAIEKELQLEGPVEAPVGEGDVFGYLVYTLDGEELGRVAVTCLLYTSRCV